MGCDKYREYLFVAQLTVCSAVCLIWIVKQLQIRSGHYMVVMGLVKKHLTKTKGRAVQEGVVLRPLWYKEGDSV